jgi:hypothetical protein
MLVAVSPAGANGQTFFYTEVVKDGRIYAFAVQSRYDAFTKTGKDAGPVIERPGYGPNGETVIFDSHDAINLYNYKHGLPGEVFPRTEEAPPPKFPSGKFSGLMFGDYYWYLDWHQDQISSTNPTVVEGQHGFWFRRLYFTYDLAFTEKLTTRFRLEANSNGTFAGGNLEPYVKDAYLKWTYKGKQQVTLGIQPTLTFDWLEGLWGLRHIEKTPADLYRLDTSRDFGITFNGPAPIDGFSYGAQFGNDSGNGSEAQEGKILRVNARYERNPGIAVEGFYSYGTRPASTNRHTAQGIAGLRNDVARVGLQYLWQERRSGQDGIPDQTISVWSGFGLPGAEGIDYWLLSSQSPFTMWIFGGEWYLHPSVRLSPNLELARYTNDPDPVNFPGNNRDSILRLTFFWTF